jgi:hypothetical protein
MKLVRNVAALAVTAAALIIPATVSAHPSVYTDVARIDTDPAAGTFTLADQTRHIVTNHGYTMLLRESNGASTKGVMDYSRLPGDYRASIPGTQVLAEGDTAAQAHATCRGVAALETEDAIRGWQGADPFFNYVPFQKTSAGLEDDPATWIDDVLALTGVDLATVADPAAACAGLGGTYTPADETQTSTANLNSGFAHDLTAPLEEEIAQLEANLSAAEQEIAQLEANLSAAGASQISTSSSLGAENASLKAEVAKLKLEATRLKIGSVSGNSVKLAGPAGKAVALKLTVSKKVAKRLKLKSRTVGTAKGKIGADAAATIPFKAASKALAKGSLKVTVTATCEDRVASGSAKLKK